MDRDFNREVNVPPTGNLDVAPDVRRSMIMARDVAPLHPELVENMSVTRTEKVEPFGSDLVHWGSIWGAFFMCLSSVLVLGSLAAWIGAVSVTPATAPPAGTVATTAGITAAVILLIATYVGGLLGGWTSNIRSRWPNIVNGLVYGSLVLVAPAIFSLVLSAMVTSITANAANADQLLRGGLYTPSGLGIDPGMLISAGANVGWLFLGSILVLALGALGFYSGMRAHLADLGFNRNRT